MSREIATGFDCSALMETGVMRVWVPFNSQINVEINFMPRKRIAELRAKATKIIWGANHQKTEEFDPIKYGELLGEEAINDWEGPILHGQPLACDMETRRKFMTGWLDFAAFISDTASDLERLVEQEKEAARKNCPSTSGRPSVIPE